MAKPEKNEHPFLSVVREDNIPIDAEPKPLSPEEAEAFADAIKQGLLHDLARQGQVEHPNATPVGKAGLGFRLGGS